MRKFKKTIILLSFVFFGGFWLLFFEKFAVLKIEKREKYFLAELAKTKEERVLGLSGRKKLCDSCGMFFVFEQAGNYAFHMKNMNFPLDIIWIKEGRAVYISENVIPAFEGVLQPEKEADRVLEINAGKAKDWGIEIGSVLKPIFLYFSDL